MVWSRGAHTGSRATGRLNVLRWALILLGFRNGISFMPPPSPSGAYNYQMTHGVLECLFTPDMGTASSGVDLSGREDEHVLPRSAAFQNAGKSTSCP